MTTIRSWYFGPPLDPDAVLYIEPRGASGEHFTVEELDAALASHKVVPADAIVIERSELPEVRPGYGAGTLSAGPIGNVDMDVALAETLRAHALGYLALAEHLAAHPPVDEAQVEAMAAEIHAVHPSPTLGDDIARHLIRNGWTKEPRP